MDATTLPELPSNLVSANGDHVNGFDEPPINSELNGNTPNPSSTFVNDDQPPESNVRTDLKHASVVSDSDIPDVPMQDLSPHRSASPNGNSIPLAQQLSTPTDMSTDSLNVTPTANEGPDTSPDPSLPTQSVNGDIPMSSGAPSPTASMPTPTPTAIEFPEITSPMVIDVLSQSNDAEEDQPPPAKRARMHSDADEASIAHSPTPPLPATNGTPAPNAINDFSPAHLPPNHLSPNQYRFFQSTVRTLKKAKDAQPFLKPVDPIALNIPQYFQIVKSPMDFATVEHKLASSNPSKPDPNPANPRYTSIAAFIADVRLIFTNCYLFNGTDHAVSHMARRLHDTFDKQIKNMPPLEAPKPPPLPKPPVVKKQSTPPAPPPPTKKGQPVRRSSASVPVIRRSDADTGATRPKREIHPPAPKDLPYADSAKKVGRKPKRVAAKDDGTLEQLKFCGKILSDLHRKQYYVSASPFYEPVDHVKLGIPDYPRVIKKPMDLTTMRKKLDNHEYASARKFEDDFRLMIKNCFAFNPLGTVVHQSGVELQRIFDERWAGLPPLHDGMQEDFEDEDEEFDDHQRAIADIETQIEAMRNNLAALKNQKPKEDNKKKKPKTPKAAQPSTSKAAAKPPKAAAIPTKKKAKAKTVTDDDVLTFEQKKDLSDAISALEPAKLERVIQIIHEGVPEIRDSTEEIELEIDLLPAPVLTKLYNFVVRPLRAPTVKRTRGGKGTGTGGLKRKSMDEDVEAEKIRLLEQRMALFEQGGNGALVPIPEGHNSEHSSDSSDDSDSSASDSD